MAEEMWEYVYRNNLASYWIKSMFSKSIILQIAQTDDYAYW